MGLAAPARDEVLRLDPSHFLIAGAKRDLWRHPGNAALGVKVGRTQAGIRGNLDEWSALQRLAGGAMPALAGLVPQGGNLQPTDQGLGLVVELVREPDGTLSPSLKRVAEQGPLPPALAAKIEAFCNLLIEAAVPLFDLNPRNLVARSLPGGGYRVHCIDVKSLGANREWTAGSSLSPFLLRRKLARRAARLKAALGME